MKAPDEFRTTGLVVRRVAADDAEPLFHGFGSSAEATRFLTWRPKSSADEYGEFIATVALRGWDEQSAFH